MNHPKKGNHKGNIKFLSREAYQKRKGKERITLPQQNRGTFCFNEYTSCSEVGPSVLECATLFHTSLLGYSRYVFRAPYR
jgi:hypothetical protein